jgi:hypothetical protein
MNLDRVEARFDGVLRGTDESLADSLKIGLGRSGNQSLGRRTETARWRQRLHPVGAGVGDKSGMPELRTRGRALGVDDVGDPAQVLGRVRVKHHAVTLHPTAWGDRAVGNGRQSDTARSDPSVELHEPIRHNALGRRPLERSRLDDPVTKRQWTQLSWLEKATLIRHETTVSEASFDFLTTRQIFPIE